MFQTKVVKKGSFVMIFALLLSLCMPMLAQKASAIRIAGPGASVPLYVARNSSGGLPGLLKDSGGSLSPAQLPVTWSSSNPLVLSVSGNTYSTFNLFGDVIVTATSNDGQSANVTYKVRRLTDFTGVPTTTAIPSIPPLFPGMTLGAAITGLTARDDQTPIGNVNVRLYGIDPSTSQEVAICNASTDASGNVSCSGLVLQAFYMFCARYDGDDVFAPTLPRCNVE